jgi:predicted negative regulator of RcsB-dependent stress response
MLTQEAIILILFLAAAGYIGWRIWKSFDKRNAGGCAKGCGCAEDKATAFKLK